VLKWTLIIVGGLAAIVALVAIIGMFLPKGHRASRTVVYNAPAPAVFAAITEFEKFPQWRSDVKSVKMLPPAADGSTRFVEEGSHGAITYKVEEREPDRRLVTRIDDPSLPFGGKWTLELKPVTEGTALTITEDGEVYNPIFRFMSKVVFSPYATIDGYQAALRRRLQS
jgi:polyketide cyclase/dehydrase/lipid transport protein